MIQLIKSFETFVNDVPELVKNSNYKTKYFIQRLHISKPTFYRKLKDNSFTVEELVLLGELLFPEEYYDWQLKNKLKLHNQDS
ncbi:hypothetical protein TPENAI_60197 [Tenacibaculum litopenaei]|uniref:hypothetical protein n=1 Tax=Tenacibaculum litopenaei TaxID=396016 RepID=UPI0038946AC8